MKAIFLILLKLLLIVIISVVITELSAHIPVNGIEIIQIRCGRYHSGLPFAYAGAWRGEWPRPLCAEDIYPKIYLLNVLFWSIILAIINQARLLAHKQK